MSRTGLRRPVLQDLRRRLAAAAPLRAAFGLALRYSGARAVSVATLLAAAWLFEVGAFATFGVFLALINLAWLAAFLRYESAIVAAADEAEAAAALRLSGVVGAAVWVACSAAALAVAALGLVPGPLAALFAAALAARMAIRLGSVMATRHGAFPALGRATLVQALIQPAALSLAAVTIADGALCLVAADMAGHGAAALYLVRDQRAALAAGGSRGAWSAAALMRTARDWAGLPLLNLPGSLLGMSFAAAPLLVTPILADPVFAGRLALAIRLFDAPTQILGAAVTPVLMNRLRQGGRAAAGFTRRHAVLFSVGIAAVLAALAVALAAVEPWLTGSALAGLGALIWMAALFQVGIAVAGPLAEAASLYQAQRDLTVINALAVAAALAALALGAAAGPVAALVVLILASLARGLAIAEELRRLSSPP